MSAANLWVLLGLGLAGIFLASRRRKKGIKEDFGAFIERIQLLPPPQPSPPKAPHPLTGLTFSIKELFDIEGYVTGFGNPDWRRTHEPAVRTAPVVTFIVQGGATCVGTNVMDEMAYSIDGVNKHYGTPTNPAAPSRIPGGSSSGSAVAVAAELVDFALGTDTGGSVRVPAAFCGILGFRPSHGAVSTVGVVPMAQSFDTVGLFTRDPNILRHVGHILLQLPFTEYRQPRRIIIADDCFEFTEIPNDQTVNVVTRSTEKLFGRQALNHISLGKYIATKVPSLKYFQNEEESRDGEGGVSALKALSSALLLLQRYEVKMNHEEWINSVKPDLGPGISARVRAALETNNENIGHCLKAKDEAREALIALLKDDAILIIPTTPGPAPKLNIKQNLLDDFHIRAFTLLSIAGMSGCCQVSIPVGQHDKCPLAVHSTLFPSGGKALGDFLHGLGLDYGLYSGAGYLQCGSTDLPASLGFEQLDAESFAEWGGDSLKYDNCYATSNSTMVDSSSTEAQSPARFQHMAAELDAVGRDIQYYVCQWGIGTDVGTWASEIGNSWRISNDIYNAWRSVWRITNQVVPQFRHSTVGAFADMDMLIIGLNALSAEEERFHFGMWAINKSPLIIGTALDPDRLSQSSLSILSNKEIIAVNQDSLAKPAQLVRRYTEEEWDVWLGQLSGSRQILGIPNWKNDSQAVDVDLVSLGIATAHARDIWAATDLGPVSGSQKLDLAGHELRLWLLFNISTATPPMSLAYYHAVNASITGSARTSACPAGTCLPTGSKVGNINGGASITFDNVRAKSTGKKELGIDFINHDYAFTTAWELGDNVRNMSVSVNGGNAKRWAFPLSGGNWDESGRLTIEVDGLIEGTANMVKFETFGNGSAPDIVGFEVWE